MGTQRTRTPSDVKWLANELAALAGELEQINAQMRRLRKRRAKVQAAIAALSQVTALVGAPDLALPVPPVRAHGAYRGRGNLTRFILDTLRSAHPQAIDTIQLTVLAVSRFGLSLATPKEHQRYRTNVLRPTLRKLEVQGLIERVHDPKATPTLCGVWRLNSRVPRIADLANIE